MNHGTIVTLVKMLLQKIKKLGITFDEYYAYFIEGK